MSTAPLHRTRRRALKTLASLLTPWPAAAAGIAPPAATGTGHTWTVAVVPQFPAQHIRAAWLPALERLAAQTGERFTLVHAPTIDAFEALFLAGEPDFVFLNPYHMVMAARAQGYRPLVRDRAMLSGVLVVRADSPVQGVDALGGQTVAFPSPNALGASLYMRALLDAQGVAVTPAYVKTHSNVYRHVVSGLAVAGGGVRPTLQAEPPAIRDALRVLFETPPVASHPLAAHPRVPPELQARLAAQMLAWTAHAADAALLAPLQMPQPQAADFARDYTPLQRLDLARFVVGARP
jgi:phosphonate transport system substrate-binding protein